MKIFNILLNYYFLILIEFGNMTKKEMNPPANGANERSKICLVSRGCNFFITVEIFHPPVYGSDLFVY